MSGGNFGRSGNGGGGMDSDTDSVNSLGGGSNRERTKAAKPTQNNGDLMSVGGGGTNSSGLGSF